MDISIAQVIMKKRVRQDLGDITPLMDSLLKCGQLNPITLNKQFELIAGHRRLTAAQRLGWKTIKAEIIECSSTADKLRIELEENVYRKELSPEELLEGYARLERLMRPPWWKKFADWIRDVFCRIFKRKKKEVQPADWVRQGTTAGLIEQDSAEVKEKQTTVTEEV